MHIQLTAIIQHSQTQGWQIQIFNIEYYQHWANFTNYFTHFILKSQHHLYLQTKYVINLENIYFSMINKPVNNEDRNMFWKQS